MDLVKKLTINAKEYIVTLRRFDDVIDPQHGAEYHGYYIDIQSQHATITGKSPECLLVFALNLCEIP